MQIIKVELPLQHELLLSADWHVGSMLSDLDRIEDLIGYVSRRKNRFIALGGDLIEAIMSDDKRFQLETTKDAIPIRQARFVVKMLKPIKKQILFSLSGNHELSLHRFGDIQQEIICHDLEVPYGTYTTILNVYNGNKKAYNLFYTHGARSISSSADDASRANSNMRLQLKRRLREKHGSCEVMAMGHTHKLLYESPIKRLYMGQDNGKLKQKYTGQSHGDWIHPDSRHYLNTGSMMKLYYPGVSGYAERFGYDPVELGYGKIVYDGDIQSVEAVVI